MTRASAAANRLGRDEVVSRLAEVFRLYGYEGATLALISAGTGLGKGSLYHAFPGGKEEMAAIVLDHVDRWFAQHIFDPLADPSRAYDDAISTMLAGCDAYFQGGGRICLMGSFALPDSRDRFAATLRAYFCRWLAALIERLEREGLRRAQAQERAEETVLGIQGALVLARAMNEREYFSRELSRLRWRLLHDLRHTGR